MNSHMVKRELSCGEALCRGRNLDAEGEMQIASTSEAVRRSFNAEYVLTATWPELGGYIHGSNILYKLFEITNAIVDVVIHMPDASRDDIFSRILYLGFIAVDEDFDG